MQNDRIQGILFDAPEIVYFGRPTTRQRIASAISYMRTIKKQAGLLQKQRLEKSRSSFPELDLELDYELDAGKSLTELLDEMNNKQNNLR
jgi:ribosome-binding factor A